MKKIDYCIHLLSAVFIVMIFYSNLEAQNTKNTETLRDTIKSITDSEISDLENKLRDDPTYQWKLLAGDRKRTVTIILAALNKNPDNFIMYSMVELCFAADQNEAKPLPVEERSSRYKYALDYLQKSLQALESVKITDVNRDEHAFLLESIMMNVAIASLEAGELSSAKLLAKEILSNNLDTNSWNYGNVIHKANTILGRIAIQENNLEMAKDKLLKSANTIGSPQLNSFGPSFVLARELLEKGEMSIVIEYLDLVAKFWANNAELLNMWKNEIKMGNVPQHQKWR